MKTPECFIEQCPVELGVELSMEDRGGGLGKDAPPFGQDLYLQICEESAYRVLDFTASLLKGQPGLQTGTDDLNGIFDRHKGLCNG